MTTQELQDLLEEEAKLTPAPWTISFELFPRAITIGTEVQDGPMKGNVDDFKQFATISKCEACAKRSKERWDDATCWTNYLAEYERIVKLRNSFRAVVEELITSRNLIEELKEDYKELYNKNNVFPI